MNRAPKAKSPLGFKVALAAASLLVSWMLLEILVRLFGLAPAIREIGVNITDSIYRRCANPILGYELRPGAKTLKSEVNSQGLLGAEKTVKKPPGVRRIMLVGDSILEPDDKATDELMDAQLEKLYRNPESRAESLKSQASSPKTDATHPDSGSKIEVLNLGVGGYNTLMEVERLKVKGLEYEPDVVVLIFVENDFDNIACERAVLSGMARPAWVDRLFRNSRLFRLLCLKLDWFGFQADVDPIKRGLAAIGTNNVARALPLFKELAVKHHFEPYLAIWPRFTDDTVTNVHFLGDGRTVVVEALAQMSDIPTHRLSEFFNSYLKLRGGPANPNRDLTYGDGMHPKAEGVRIAALALKSMLDSPRPATAPNPRELAVKAEAAKKIAQTLGIQGVDYKAALLQYGKWMEETVTDSNHLSKAVQYYETVLKMDPNDFQAHSSLGRVFRQLGQRAKALEHLHRALQLRPSDAELQKQIQEISQ